MAAYIGRIQDANGADVYPQVKKEGIIDFPTDLIKTGDITFQPLTNAGLTLLNGAKKPSNSDKSDIQDFHYSYIQFKGFKVVTLSISFKDITKRGTEAVQLPSKVAPNSLVETTGQAGSVNSYAVYIQPTGKISVVSPVDNFTQNSLFYCCVTYLRKD